MKQFGYTRELSTSFMETLDDIMFSLKEQGFGVINTIDVQERIIEKLGKNIEEYIILGACNPSFASDALDIEYEMGLFFPCNVIVYKKDSRVFVSTILPTLLMGAINNEGLQKLAKNLEEKLIKAVETM